MTVPVAPAPVAAVPVLVPKTSPLAAGTSTSEGIFAHIVILTTGAAGVLGTIATLIASMSSSVPPGTGTLGVYLALAGFGAATISSGLYGISRAIVKAEAIRSGKT